MCSNATDTTVIYVIYNLRINQLVIYVRQLARERVRESESEKIAQPTQTESGKIQILR